MPIVVPSPCPVCTVVSAGSANSLSRIDPMIVGKSENERPVAPGPPENRVSPENSSPASGRYRQTEPGE